MGEGSGERGCRIFAGREASGFFLGLKHGVFNGFSLKTGVFPCVFAGLGTSGAKVRCVKTPVFLLVLPPRISKIEHNSSKKIVF